jgi:hypothetical protein
MNHPYHDSIRHGSFSIASNGLQEIELSERVQHAPFSEDDLRCHRNDVSSSLGKDLFVVTPSRSPNYLKSSLPDTKKSYGRDISNRSSRHSAARDFAIQYCAAKRLSGSVTSFFGSNDSLQDDSSATAGPDFVSFKATRQRPSNFEEEERKEEILASPGKLSVSEMKQLVMDSLPPEISEHVPASAWQRIFSDDNTTSNGQSPLVRRLRRGSKDDVSDIVSVISNIVTRRSGGTAMSSSDSDLLRDDLTSPRTFCLPVEKKNTVGNPRTKTADVPTLLVDDIPTLITTKSLQVTGLSPAAAATGATNNSKGKRKHRVRFKMVGVRNYGSILTINPAVTTGPAVGLGWDFDPEQDEQFSVDDFERSKVRSGPRRFSVNLLLGCEARVSFLLSLGYSEKEIAETVRQTIRIKNKRKQTVQNHYMFPLEEILEKATRKVKRVLGFFMNQVQPRVPHNNKQ